MGRTVPFALVIGFSLVTSAAWAGDLRCVVTGKEGPQADVQVTVTPGGTTLTTARDGTCLFRGLREGTYRVTAEKTVGGQLRGAVADDVRVRASGRADAKLRLVRAIHIHEYTPLCNGSTWAYRRARAKPNPWRTDGWLADGQPVTMEGTVGGAARFAGADVTKVEWTWSGFLGGPLPAYTMYETSGPEGHAIHGRTPVGGDEPGYQYDPPLLIPNLLPIGYRYRVTTRVRYTDATPSTRVTRTYTLTKLERREVTAGAFDDCARIEWTEDSGGTTTTGVTHLARGVGMVSMIFDDRQTEENWKLQRYRLPAPSALRTVPRAVKPKPPSGTVQTPGKSVPSK
jgi:hypothetical protein